MTTVFTPERRVDVLVEYLPVRSAIRNLRNDQRSVDLNTNPAALDAPPWVPGARRARVSLFPIGEERSSGLYCSQSGHGTASLGEIVAGAGHDRSVLKKLKNMEPFWLEQSSGIPFITKKKPLQQFAPTRHEVNLAVFAPCLGYGDAMAAGTALAEVKQQLSARGHVCRLHIFTNPCQDPDVFSMAGSVDTVDHFPIPIESLAVFDAVLDLNGIGVERNRSLVDSLLDGIGLDAHSVPVERKRLDVSKRGRPPEHLVQRLSSERLSGRRLIFLNARASNPMRSMPSGELERLLNSAPSSWRVVSAMPGLNCPGIADISKESITFSDLVHAVALCDGVITVDTSALYISAALGLPATAFFTNNDGNIWARPYLTVRPVQVCEPGPLAHLHASNDATMVAYAHSQWKNLNYRNICHELDERIASCQPVIS